MQLTAILQAEIDGFHSKKIAFFGAGGKTSLMFAIADELKADYRRILITSLTRAGMEPGNSMLYHVPLTALLLKTRFENHNPVYLMHASSRGNKLTGLTESELNLFFPICDLCLFECDGARSRPIKVHREQDPRVPADTDYVVVLVGADAVGATLDSGKIHRPELFAGFWNFAANQKLSPEFIAEIVTSKRGYGSRIAENMNTVYFVNKADAFPEEALALARALRGITDHPVYYGSVQQKQYESVD